MYPFKRKREIRKDNWYNRVAKIGNSIASHEGRALGLWIREGYI
jgi:hypothetical protein